MLIKIDPKLGELATLEAGPSAEGNLFGDPFVKELGKFVNTFNSLDKAQTSVKRIFSPCVFGAAGRGRGRSTGRPYGRASFKSGEPHRGQYQDPDKFGNFYPTRAAGAAGGEATPPSTISKVRVRFGGEVCLGGRLKLFLRNWSLLTSDAWVLQTVQGFQLEFSQIPAQRLRPWPLQFTRDQISLIDAEVSELLRKGAIVPASLHPQGFLSNIFLVEKQDGGYRPVINLRELNIWLVYRHFKMEGIHLLRDLLQDKDWMVRLDLKDA